MKDFFRALINAIFPRRCAYCGRVVSASEAACPECEKMLPRVVGEVCPRCGREKSVCVCGKAEKYYERLVAPFYFEGIVRKGIHVFKFRNGPQNARAYAEEMAKTVKERYAGIKFDFITEVPTTKKSLRSRGYSQERLLARELSKPLGIERKSGLLVKLYETKKQQGLNRLLRSGNLTGVFDVSDPDAVKGKTVLLCDDVSTSGETLNECAKTLWLYGAESVFCVTVALTPAGKKEKAKTDEFLGRSVGRTAPAQNRGGRIH